MMMKNLTIERTRAEDVGDRELRAEEFGARHLGVGIGEGKRLLTTSAEPTNN
jgi:hypothetical protein